MKKQLIIIKATLLLMLVISCNKEDSQDIVPEFVVAFENKDASFTATEKRKKVKLVFSNTSRSAGTIILEYTESGVVYGEDYTTLPATSSGSIELPFKEGQKQVSFTINKLKNALEDTANTVSFTIKQVSLANAIIQGNTNFALNFTEVASSGAIIAPLVGGPNQPNQVYVDLSSQLQTQVKRDTWDLGFYNGDEFRVKINGAIFMGAAKLGTTDLNSVTENSVATLQVQIKTSAPNTGQYFDEPTGDITKTAIEKISAIDSENFVYLIKLGFKVSQKAAENGSVELSGDARGWKKIRVLKQSSSYVLQYANLNDVDYNEITISKKADFNFNFFSFDTERLVNIEPNKNKWDLNFTVFTNVIDFGNGSLGGYGFSDFVTTNVYGNVSAYQVLTEDVAYDTFNASNVNELLFMLDKTVIGSNWRSVFSRLTKSDRFYVLKDESGNIYKIRFNNLVDERGERGYPSFEYSKL